eukprot:jgi/Mesen1/10856/ME000093S10370
MSEKEELPLTSTTEVQGAAASASSAAAATPEEELTLSIKWSGKEYTVRVCGDDTVGELKRRICEQTNVQPKRQKLLNLKAGGRAADDTMLLSQLTIKPAVKIMMMGTVEEEILVDPVNAPEVVDDFEMGEEETVEIKDREENQQKLRRRAANFQLKILNPPRPGKKLLVLDIDYTLFDHRSTAENPHELMRPHLHEFLAASYSEYDIIIWSATSLKWIEVKMRELGVASNPSYKIVAYVDHLAMITVQSQTRGVFDCKPLGVIWAKFPENYHAGNTIMFDDLRRNFVMNPQNGLVIRPFRKAHVNRASDRELVVLTDYLLAIADLADLSKLDHQRWEKFLARLRQ